MRNDWHISGERCVRRCALSLLIYDIQLSHHPNKVWINQGDIILLSLREFQDGKADVIVKYTADEARNRKSIQCQMLDVANADVESQ